MIARRVKDGETIAVTRGGKPVIDLVPQKPTVGVDFAAGEAFPSARGIVCAAGRIAEDLDDPMPDDFLPTPLQEL